MHRQHSRTWAVGLASFAAGAAGVAGIGAALAATSADATIAACVTTKDGSVRIVSTGTTCKRGETSLAWNQQGPRGAPGIVPDDACAPGQLAYGVQAGALLCDWPALWSETEPNTGLSNANPMSTRTVNKVSGSIAPSGDADFFVLHAPTPGTVSFRTTGDCDRGTLDTAVSVMDSTVDPNNSGQLPGNDDAGSSICSAGEVHVAAGNVTLVLGTSGETRASADSTGAYQLRASFTPDP